MGCSWAQTQQASSPPEEVARVYAYDALGSFVAIPIGEIAAGPLAMHYGNTNVLLSCAVAVLVATFAVSFTPAIRKLDNSAQVRQHR